MADKALKEKRVEGKPGPYCGSCPYRDQPLVDGGGKPGRWMLVGQGPGAPDVKAKRLFTGVSGYRLKKQLSFAGIIYEDCWVEGVVRCEVPKTRKPTKTAMRCCRPLLEESIRECKPHTVITLGASAFEAFYPGGKLGDYHGSKIKGDSYTLVPMFMPNAQDDNPDLIRTIYRDYDGLQKRKFLEPASGTYVMADKWPKIVNDRFGYDSETTGLDLRSRLLGVSISQQAGEGCYIPADKVPRGIKVNDTAVMWNAKYDLGIAESNGVCKIDDWADVDDAMCLAYCMNRKPLGLKANAIQELQVEMTKFKDVAEGDSLEGVEDEDVMEYAGADAEMPLRLWDHLWRLATPDERNLYTQIEKPLPRILAKMQLAGVLVDVAYFERLSVEMDKELASAAAAFKRKYGLEPETLTSPTRLAAWLSSALKRRISATGRFDLEKLEGIHPVIKDLLEWRPRYKLKTSFVDSILRLQKNGLLFPQFNQTGTGTGRMSASGPNLQQLPKRTDKTVRKGFVAPAGFLVASLDNSQIDLRSLAFLSQDEELNRIFSEDLDVHNETAMRLKGELTEAARRLAKTANFLVVFGGGSEALAKKTEVEDSIAAAFLDDYWELHTGVKAWVGKTHKFLYDNGYVETAYKRRRYIPAVYTDLKKSAERMGQNMPVQGTSADILKLQMAAVAKTCLPWAQVHDELLFYVEERGWKERVRELKRLMESVDAPFGLKVEAAIGPSLGEVKKVEFN